MTAKQERKVSVKLAIVERIQLLNLLPAEGNAITLRVVNELRQELSFSEREIKDANIQNDAETGRVTWKDDAKLIKDVKVGDTANGIIKEALKKLDDEKKLTLAVMPVYERFMEGK